MKLGSVSIMIYRLKEPKRAGIMAWFLSGCIFYTEIESAIVG